MEDAAHVLRPSPPDSRRLGRPRQKVPPRKAPRGGYFKSRSEEISISSGLTLHPSPQNLHPTPQTLHPGKVCGGGGRGTSGDEPKHAGVNPTPYTLNPKP